MKIGFIGAGNMATAMMRGMINSHQVKPTDVWAGNDREPALKKVSKELGVNTTTNNKEVAMKCDVIFLSIKPFLYGLVIDEIKELDYTDKIIVTIAPGITLEEIGEMFGKAIKVVRTMPNTPAMVLEGMTGVCQNQLVTDEELEQVLELLRSFSKAEIVHEDWMNAVVVVSGSSPAYVYMFIEAMADAAVREGMPRDLAYQFAAQATLGSAKMVLETGLHPGELKDMVCSPRGTTIEAVKVLERTGFRSSIMEAMDACARKCE